MNPIRITVETFREDVDRYLALCRQIAVTICFDGQGDVTLLGAQEVSRTQADPGQVTQSVEDLDPDQLRELEKSEIAEQSRDLDRLLPEGWPENLE